MRHVRPRLEALLDRGAGWTPAVIGLTVVAVLVRLLIIAHSRGGVDLRAYVYFSRLPLHGINPFGSHHGMFPPVDGNNTPLEVWLFELLLRLHDSPTTLRVVFVLADALVLLVIGLRFPRTRRWRLGMLLFYGFNPFVLISFTAFAEDKTILFLGIVLWILTLELAAEWGSWIVVGALAAFKFLGSFALPAMAVHSWRRDRRRCVLAIAAFVAIVIIGSLPWFPKSLDAFSRRDARLGLNPPLHAAPTLLLSRLGIYAPVEAKLALVIAIVAVFALYVTGRLEIREAVVWSIFAGYVFLPDEVFSRILLITLPFLLLIDLPLRRWVVIWVITCVEALATWVAVKGVPHELSSVGGLLRGLFAHEATVRHVLWINLLPVVVLGYYLLDRRAGRAPIGAPEPAETLSH